MVGDARCPLENGDGAPPPSPLPFPRQSNADLLPAVRCSLGALGVLYSLKLQVAPAYRLKSVEVPAGLDATLAALPALIPSAEFFRFWWGGEGCVGGLCFYVLFAPLP